MFNIVILTSQTTATQMDSPYGVYLLQTVLALIAVILLSYMIIKWVLKGLLQPSKGRGVIEIIERLPLSQNQSICLIKIGKSLLLIGVAPQGVELIKEISPDEWEILEKQKNRPKDEKSFKEIFQKLIIRKSSNDNKEN